MKLDTVNAYTRLVIFALILLARPANLFARSSAGSTGPSLPSVGDIRRGADWNTPVGPIKAKHGAASPTHVVPSARFEGKTLVQAPSPNRIQRPRTTIPPLQPGHHNPVPQGGGVALTVSPSVIDNDYYGFVNIAIDNLTNGETVLLEKFMVTNQTGTMDGSAQLVQSLTLTDGMNNVIGGVTNFMAAADTDGTNGDIVANLSFLDRFSPQIVGQYVYEVVSPTGRFAPATAPFKVTEDFYPQRFQGTVTNDSGAPVPYAFVVLLDESTGSGVFVAGTRTDGEGNYEISSVPGQYAVMPAQAGMVGNVFAAGLLPLAANETNDVDLALHATDYSISGNITDAVNTNAGLAGVLMLLLTDANDFTFGYTDVSGNFNVPVTANYWNFIVCYQLIPETGYVAPDGGYYLDTTESNVTELSLPLPFADAIIYGQVTTPLNVPVAGALLGGHDYYSPYQAYAITDPNGNYVMPTIAYYWYMGLLPSSSTENAYMVPYGSWFIVNEDQPVTNNLLVYPVTADIQGTVTTLSGAPAPNLPIYFFEDSGDYTYAYAETDQNGNYNQPVAAGLWSVSLDSYDEFFDGSPYVATTLPDLAVTNGQTVLNWNLIVALATNNIFTTLISDGQTNTYELVTATTAVNGTIFTSDGLVLNSGVYDVPVFSGAVWTLMLDTNEVSSSGFLPVTNQQCTFAAGDTNDVAVTIYLQDEAAYLFTTLSSPAPGPFSVTVTGNFLQEINLEASSDLIHWVSLTNNMTLYGFFGATYTDLTSTNYSQRYYRAVNIPQP